MHHHDKQVWTYAAVTVFTAIGCLCAVVIITKLPYWGEKTAEWVGALGTIAAFVGTIALATSEARRRRREEIARANLHIAALAWKLAHAYANVQAIADAMPRFILKELPVGLGTEMVTALDEIPSWEIDDVLPLVPLSGNLAARLAQAPGSIRQLKSMINDVESVKKNSPEKVLQHAEAIFLLTLETRGALNAGVHACKQARVSVTSDAAPEVPFGPAMRSHSAAVTTASQTGASTPDT